MRGLSDMHHVRRTHDRRASDHAELLTAAGGSLLARQSGPAARGLSGRVPTMVSSAFGRRPEDDDSDGTDHRVCSLMMIVGDRADGDIPSARRRSTARGCPW